MPSSLPRCTGSLRPALVCCYLQNCGHAEGRGISLEGCLDLLCRTSLRRPYGRHAGLLCSEIPRLFAVWHSLKCCAYEWWKRAGSGIKEGIRFPPMCAAACSAGANAQQDTVKRAGSEPFGVWWLISCHNWLIVWRCCCRSEPGRVKWEEYRDYWLFPVIVCICVQASMAERRSNPKSREGAGCRVSMCHSGRCAGLWAGLAGLHSWVCYSFSHGEVFYTVLSKFSPWVCW